MLCNFQSGERELRFFARADYRERNASTMTGYCITRKFDVDLPTVVGELENAAAPSASAARSGSA